MAPILHCIRHAQGYHNLNTANHSIQDPELTDFGKEQCATLSREFPFQNRVSKVIASPLRRTIDTALLSLEPAISAKHITILALPEIQETSNVPCDTGSDPPVLAKKYSSQVIDLHLVKDGWNDKRFGGPWAPTSAAISARARDARQIVRDIIIQMVKTNNDSDIALVSHGGFLHYFTEDWEDGGANAGTAWHNTEYRSYTFATLEPETPSTTKPSSPSSSADSLHHLQQTSNTSTNDTFGLVHFENDFSNATLIETSESRVRRGKPAQAPSRKEQHELFKLALEGWESQGLQNPSKLGEVNGEVVDNGTVDETKDPNAA